MSLQQYLNNKVLATISVTTTTDTLTSVSIFAPGLLMANSGDVVTIIHKGTGRQYDVTLTTDLTSTSTRLEFSSTTFDTIIPEGSIIIDKNNTFYERNRSSLQYINFSSQVAATQNWKTFSTSGISNHTWNTETSDTGTTVDTSQITGISTSIQSVGIVVPFDCTLIGFRATIFRVGNFQTAVGLFCGTPQYNDNATQDFTLRAYGAADNSAGPDSNYSQRPVKAEDLTRSFSLSAGDIILPAFNSVTNDGGNARISYTLVLKTYKLL
tara:strand:+ start:406 stop:1209 length:804 start_codon:yes stop_codon:yes gene_type:complete